MSETADVNPHDEVKRKCDGLRYDLKVCLLQSDCVTKHGRMPKKCLQEAEMAPFVPDNCWALANAFFECKRSTMDMRRRFRGIKGY